MLEKFDSVQKLKKAKTAIKYQGEINNTSNLITAVTFFKQFIVTKNITNATQNSK